MVGTLMAKVLEGLPNPVYLYDRELKVLFANAAARLLSEEQELEGKQPGEAVRCVNARLGPSGCGSGEACRACSLRRAIVESLTTQIVVRQHLRLTRDAPAGPEVRHLRVLASPLEHAGALYCLVELLDESELVTLRGLLPFCARCGRARFAGDDAEQDEARARVLGYFAGQPEVGSEALCEECRERTAPGAGLQSASPEGAG